MPISFESLHPDVGVQISGCDLSRALPEQDFKALVEAYYRYSVVVIRGQSLTPIQQAVFVRSFGTPKISQRKEFHVAGVPEIGRVGNVKNPDGTPAAFLDRYGDLWHSDTASDDHLDGVTMLYCVETPKVGGDTCFVSLSKAYETLPADLKARIAGRQVTHNFNKHNDYLLARNQGAAKPLSPADRAKWEDRVHDLVQTHPVTGRQLYFISPTLVKTISGYTEVESQELARLLVEHATRPESVYRHKWQVGDLVFWDNRASLHSASPANYVGGNRLMHRGYAYVDTTH
ncbi:TauD/TfdA dioxygenase family protein [Candidimonas nitroreducens]|uniref:Taurine dioxygenase n=1 Tax=Candidimonas nitroreducens TaxID=683354 RepID=A0A225MG61_9BURK|nr:TauD/TfdA family dioxygenase [Candidimonas nitroreducens]OWT60178.1 taurine dioxygenase [Candidimonas nitroreducens]